MVTNTKIDPLDLTADRFHALEAEVERLKVELAEEQAHSASLKRLVDKAKERIRELDDPGAGGVDLGFTTRANEIIENEQPSDTRGRKSKRRGSRKKRGVKAEKKSNSRASANNVYVFDDQDEAMIAFDQFFANPDPDLDKVRGFLLD